MGLLHLSSVIFHNQCMRAVQKVLSLAPFSYVFVRKNVMGLSSGFLLVFIKNFMSSACLLCKIWYTEKSWLDIVTDFNKIHHSAVTEFLTLKNIQPQQVHNQIAVVYGEYVPSYATVKHPAAEFRWGRRSLEVEPQSGCPSEALCEENCHAVVNPVLQNHGVSV